LNGWANLFNRFSCRDLKPPDDLLREAGSRGATDWLVTPKFDQLPGV
jgi:hypothetical protein